MAERTLAQLTMSKEEGDVLLKCKHHENGSGKFNDCGYTWVYGGNMPRATCPSCGRKTELEGNRIDQ